MSDRKRATPNPGRIIAWVVAVLVALVALFFLFQFVETLLPANF